MSVSDKNTRTPPATPRDPARNRFVSVILLGRMNGNDAPIGPQTAASKTKAKASPTFPEDIEVAEEELVVVAGGRPSSEIPPCRLNIELVFIWLLDEPLLWVVG